MGAEHVSTQVPGSLRAYVTAGKGFLTRVLISKKEIFKKGGFHTWKEVRIYVGMGTSPGSQGVGTGCTCRESKGGACVPSMNASF